MIRVVSSLPFAAAALFCASPAFAQAGDPASAKQQLPEIERGFYTEFDFGTVLFLGGDAADNVQPGVMAGFGFGSDIGRYLKVEFRMLNSTADSSGNVYRAVGNIPDEIQERNPCPDDPTEACTTAPDVQISLVTAGIKGVYPLSERLELQGLLGGGVVLGNPSPDQIFEFDPDAQLATPEDVETGSTPIFGFGVGVEYFTTLRHFSVGANAAVWLVPGPGGMMATVFPTIKYTF